MQCHLLDDTGGGRRPTAPAGGKAYFITNGEPVVLWDWVNQLLRGLGHSEITKRVPLSVAYAAGGLMVTWTVRKWRLLLIPTAAVNVALIAATFLTGAHYFVDVLITVAMFAASVLLYRVWGARHVTLQPHASEASV